MKVSELLNSHILAKLGYGDCPKRYVPNLKTSVKYADDYEDWYMEKLPIGVRRAHSVEFGSYSDRNDGFLRTWHSRNKIGRSRIYKQAKVERVRPLHRQEVSCTITLYINDIEIGSSSIDEAYDFMRLSEKYGIKVTVQ